MSDVYDPKALRESGELVPLQSPEDKHAREIEALQTESQIEDRLRANAARALIIQGELLDRAAEASKEELASTLRAVTDVTSKNVGDLFRLTGRDRPQQEGMVDMLSAMANKGYLRLNVNLDVQADPPSDEPDP